jgi:hypothetical protein
LRESFLPSFFIMGKLIELSNKLKQLTAKRLEDEVLSIIRENETTLTNMNTDQLFQGQDSKGKSLPDYSERSVQVFGKPSGPMKLFDTGDFYRGFFVRADKFPVVFESSDRKSGKIADLLAAKGEDPDDIYGINKANLKDFSRNYLLPDLQKFLRNFLHV